MSDRVIRAITIDGSFRVIAVRTTELVQRAIALQKVQGEDATVFGELLTGTVLVRETMSPAHRVQAILSRPEAGQMLADAHPDDGGGKAMTRGLVNRAGAVAPKGKLFDDGTLLKVIRSLPRGRLHQSIVSVGEAGGEADDEPSRVQAQASEMSRALMTYMQESEQVVSTLRVVALVEGERVVAAGGFIVQLLPELHEAQLAVMTERLAHDFSDLAPFLREHDADARHLLAELLYGMPHEVLFDGEVFAGCDCSEARVLTAIATLGRQELTDMVARGEAVSLTCEYCQTPYTIGTGMLSALLVPS